MTKKMFKTSVALAAVIGLTAFGSARAEEDPAPATNATILDALTLDVGVDVYSLYVWRGMLLTDAPVFQPSVTVGFAGFALNVWGSFDITDENEANNGDDYKLQELDYTLSYDFSVGEMVNLGVGYIEYTFPGTPFERSSEVYASVGLNTILEPSLTVYWDFDEVEGFYATLGIGHTFELTESLGLSLGAGISWGDQEYHEVWFGPDTKGLSDYNLSASLDYAVTDNLGISLIVAYSDFIESNIEDAAESSYNDSANIYGGISIGYSF